VLHRAASPAPAQAWSGLLIDEWTEVIPAATEETSLSLQHDHPRAEAPQAVLVAVPPASAMVQWDFETVFDIVRETLELAQIRGNDLETLGAMGQLLPALTLAANTSGEAIATSFQSTPGT